MLRTVGLIPSALSAHGITITATGGQQMGIRYRKGFKIIPGLRLNLNAHSVSLTGGGRGAHVTYNSKGYRTTSVGAPGTGLSYRTTRRLAGTRGPSAAQSPTTTTHWFHAILLSVLGCAVLQALTGHWWLFFVGIAAILLVRALLRARR
jgi:hypothetical protein